MAQFNEKATVTINCGTTGASIKYTTDGTSPNASVGTAYSSPFVLYENATVKAIATKSGLIDSEIATTDITVKLPNKETFYTVTVNGDTATIKPTSEFGSTFANYSGVNVVYTTDGTEPKEDSTEFDLEGLTVEKNCTVKFKAFRSSKNVASDVVSLAISALKVDTPVISVA